MQSIEGHMRTEKENGTPCRLTVTLTADGQFRARLSFAPGMPSAVGEGLTVADAIERLENNLA
jgi:hypothetical protein